MKSELGDDVEELDDVERDCVECRGLELDLEVVGVR
jgi:hypothetical protein